MTTSGIELNRQNDSNKQVYVFPASFAQRRLWFLYQLDPFSPIYNITAPLEIDGPIDCNVLRRSLDEVTFRHESLRTVFSSVRGEPVQVVTQPEPFGLEVKDLSFLSEMEQEEEIYSMSREDRLQPFNLRKGPLIRATLLRRAEHRHVLLLTMHHIISDGWSLGVLLQEVSTLYEAFEKGLLSPLPELPIQYADFSEWQRNWLTGEVLDAQLDYWKKQLSGAPPALELPTDRPRPVVASHHGAQHPVGLSGEMVKKLYYLARQHGATLYMILAAAFNVLLYRYSRQTDILIGTPIAGRTRQELECLIGFFVNTLIIRTKAFVTSSFAGLLEQVRDTTLGAYAHQDVPFEKLVEVLSPQRNLSRTPFFQVMFVLQNNALPQLRLGPALLHPLESTSETSKFELTLSLHENADTIRGYIEYNVDLFEPSTITRMARQFEKLLTSALNAPHQAVSSLHLLTAGEIEQIVHEWSGTGHAHPLAECVHQLFEAYAENHLNQVAVSGEDGSLTYGQLNRKANRLARHLRSLGVKAETSVAIFMEPSLDMMIALLGILKAGGSYVPLDPIFPKDRISYILEDSAAPVLLTRKAMQGQLPVLNLCTIFMDEYGPELSRYATHNLPNATLLEGRIYTIYTSGSTGRPKGVEVEQRQILNYVDSIIQRFALGPGAHYAMLQPLAVDSSNTVLFPFLCTGGTLHVMPRGRATDPDAVIRYFRNHRIDLLKIAPSHLAAMLEAQPSQDLLPQSVLALGGEASNWLWLQNTVLPLAMPGCKTFIHYGPTETTVGMLTYKVDCDSTLNVRSAPLGQPLAHAKVYLLDDEMLPVPIGIAGEIYIGGQCVARGYFKQPGLTANRFIPDPFAQVPGARLYRTGDLGRWLPGGDIEFLGRNDHQVKVRGFRIELGEVEAALREHPQVERAVAIASEDGAGGKQLVAYVVPKRPDSGKNGASPINDSIKDILLTQLRVALKERLPDYMVPAAIVVLDQMPLSPQGKVDFQNLPQPSKQLRTNSNGLVKPRNPIEAQLVDIWEEILNTPVGVTDDFFQLGGHSLLALRMMTLARQRLGRTLPLASLFRNPTISYLAKQLSEAADNHASPILIEIQPHGAGTPFFCVHPIGGAVLCYWDLAKAMGSERPFWGLQAPPSSSASPSTIEEIASLYIKDIKQIQKTGPYLLSGWSMGGLIAYEIAQQLGDGGDEVNFLAMFDTYPPSKNSSLQLRSDLPELARFGADMMRLAGKDASGLQDHFLNLSPLEQRQLVFQTLKNENILVLEEEMDELLHTFTRHATALEKYSLRTAKQPITLFSSIEGQPQFLSDAWKVWAPAGFNAIEVPGDHYSMIQNPHAEKLGVILNDRLGVRHQKASVGM